MDWSDVGKKIISVGAPLLGGALGGPAGAAIGQVVASQFGLTEAIKHNARELLGDRDRLIRFQDKFKPL